MEVSGFIALYDAKPLSDEYALTIEEARRIIEKNANIRIPLCASHGCKQKDIDCTIGYVDKITSTEQGLHVTGYIDDATFLEITGRKYKVYVKEFIKRPDYDITDYLAYNLSGFSLSHNRTDDKILHVALVDVGARRGTLVTYRVAFQIPIVNTRHRSDVTYFRDFISSYFEKSKQLCGRREVLLREDAQLNNLSANFIYAQMPSDKSGDDTVPTPPMRPMTTPMNEDGKHTAGVGEKTVQVLSDAVQSDKAVFVRTINDLLTSDATTVPEEFDKKLKRICQMIDIVFANIHR